MLEEFITLNRDVIIERCRAKVAARSIPAPSEAEINHGVPLFLDQLVAALRSGHSAERAIDRSAGQHGHDLLLQGFTVSQVVHDYGDVCQTITEMALETNAPIATDDFRMLNKCLDEAIAGAVTMYARESQRAQHEEATGRDTERMGFLVHELRNLVSTAMVAFEVLKTGNVGVAGSTGAVLDRSLTGLRDLIARSLEDVRLIAGVRSKTRITLSTFIARVAAAATLEARTRGVTLLVTPVPDDVAVDAEHQVLEAVIGNLLQNAFKFTQPHTTVRLSVETSADRVLIAIADACGGLPGDGDPTELFRAFEQRSGDRSGLGIGLAFSRWGAEANGGKLSARNLPGKGCVFTIDLPRSAVPAPEYAPTR
jgi:signal transduction histidine kinase